MLSRALRRRWLQDALLALVPALFVAGVALTGTGGPRARFEGLAAGLVLAAALGAFGQRAPLRGPVAALLVGVVVLMLGGTPVEGLAAAWLLLAVVIAASGLVALGRRFGTPSVPAGAVALGILAVAMAGLFWADPAAEVLPRSHRHAFRQAVLDVDLALAAAYDGAGFDRMRAKDVYFRVPLASGLIRAPSAFPTGSWWLGTGLVLGAASWLWGRGRKRKNAGAARRPTEAS